MSDMAFIWSRVRMAKVADPDSCWLWTGTNASGYGIIQRSAKMKRRQAHRFLYEQIVGPIPEGLTLDHLCHNRDRSCPGGKTCMHRRCVNPAHMEPVPDRVNVARGQSPPARNARKEACPKGHPYEPGNLRPLSNGWRQCVICHRELVKESASRKASPCQECGGPVSQPGRQRCWPCHLAKRRHQTPVTASVTVS